MSRHWGVPREEHFLSVDRHYEQIKARDRALAVMTYVSMILAGSVAVLGVVIWKML